MMTATSIVSTGTDGGLLAAFAAHHRLFGGRAAYRCDRLAGAEAFVTARPNLYQCPDTPLVNPDRIGQSIALGFDETLSCRDGGWRRQCWSTSIADVGAGRLLETVSLVAAGSSRDGGSPSGVTPSQLERTPVGDP